VTDFQVSGAFVDEGDSLVLGRVKGKIDISGLSVPGFDYLIDMFFPDKIVSFDIGFGGKALDNVNFCLE